MDVRGRAVGDLEQLDALIDAERGARRCDRCRMLRLATERRAEFVARITAGPCDGDGVCTLRAADARRILNEEFGAAYSLAGVYDLMHRLGLACLKPRPRHEKCDPAAMGKFREERAPPLSAP